MASFAKVMVNDMKMRNKPEKTATIFSKRKLLERSKGQVLDCVLSKLFWFLDALCSGEGPVLYVFRGRRIIFKL